MIEPFVSWWAVYSGPGDYLFTQPIHWLAPPAETPPEYAARLLLELDLGADKVVPRPPDGLILCAIYSDHPEEDRPDELLGEARRVFMSSAR